MRSVAIAAIALPLASCGGPTWPDEQFPARIEVTRTLFAGGGGFFRETCEALVVEISDRAAVRIFSGKMGKNGPEVVPPAGWKNTPLIKTVSDQAFYEGAFGGCKENGDSPLGDLPGALTRPGAFYKIVNGGEGIAVIVPRAQLAGFFYFG